MPSNSLTPVKYISIDLAKLNATEVAIPSDEYAQVFLGYGAAEAILNGTTPLYGLEIDTGWFFDGSGASVKYYAYTNTSPTPIIGNYSAITGPVFFLIEGFTQPLAESVNGQALNATAPIDVFYRFYNSVPYGNKTIVEPMSPSVEMLHIHSVVGPKPLLDLSGLGLFCGDATISTIPTAIGYTGSETVYRIDTNTDPGSCLGVAEDYVIADNVDIDAFSFYYYLVGGKIAYAPLVMLHGATMWTIFYAYQGLDGYNFTGTFTMGQMFRSSLFGSFDIESTNYYPLTFMLMSPNCDLNHTMVSASWSTSVVPPNYWDYWYAHGEIEPPRLCLGMWINATQLAGLGFYNNTAALKIYIVSNRTHAEGVNLIAFGYGIGVREVVPLSGYDPLFNMFTPGSIADVALIFNQPTMGVLNESSVYVTITNGEKAINASIVGWDTFNGLPVAYLEFDTSLLGPGAYAMIVHGAYYDTNTNSTIAFELALDPAIYVGVAPGALTGPATITVGPPGSGADYTSIAEAVSKAPAGSTIEVLPGTYSEELIVIDKPLYIEGIESSSGKLPVIETPHGYPAFIVLAPVEISNLVIEPAEGEVATTPTGLAVVPGEALIPPAAIIAYGSHALLDVMNLAIYGYPRGITAYGAPISAYNVTAILDQTYMVNNRYAWAKEPAPVYTYASPSVKLSHIYSEEIPIIRKTPWNKISLEKLYTGEELNTPVDILVGNGTIVSDHEMYAAIVLGSNISLVNASVTSSLEVIATSAKLENVNSTKLVTSSSAISIESSTFSFASLYSAAISMTNTYVGSGMVATDVLGLAITNSTIEGGALVITQPAAEVTITGSSLGNSPTAALYAVLRDGAELNFTNNYVYSSHYGVYIIPLYTEAAPTINIENNTFTDVAVPVYVAASPPTSTSYYYYWYSIKPAKPAATPSKPPKLPELGLTISSELFLEATVPKLYIGYNKITNATTGISASIPVAASIVENNINASITGVEMNAPYLVMMFFNNIAAPVAANLSNTYGAINYNNFHGDVVLINNSYVDVRFNYIAGNISSDQSSTLLGPEYSYPEPLAIPSTYNIVVPLPSYIEKLYVGSSQEMYMYFINPTPRPVKFQYSLSTIGSLGLSGEIFSTSPVSLKGVGVPYDTAYADIEVKATAPGTAAIKATIVTDKTYSVKMPIKIQGVTASLIITAPQSIKRGEVFNITVTVESNVSGTYTLLLNQQGSGAIGFCQSPSCTYPVSSYSTSMSLEPGNNTLTIRAIGLGTGTTQVKASLYIGLSIVQNTTSITIEPNPAIAPNASIYYYPSSLEQGTYDSIVVKISNVTIPTGIRVEAVSLNSYVDILNNNYTIMAYSSPWYTSIPIYADKVGNDTIVVKIIDVDDNVLVLNTTITITVTPSYVLGYKAIYGYVSTAANESWGNISYPATTGWADLWTYVSVSQAVTSLTSLKYMLKVPWGCVEQTTSPLLAGIQVYKYIDAKNLWDKAAEALGYDNGTALKEHIVNDIIARGVERLLETHGTQCVNASLDACGFSWYPGLGVDLFFTPYGLLGLLRAYEFQTEFNTTIYANQTRLNMTIEKLVHGLIKVQNSDGSWGDYDQVYFTSFALYSLSEAYRLGFKPYNASLALLESSIANATQFLEKGIENTISLGGDVGEVIAGLYALAAVASNGLPVNTTVIADAIHYIADHPAGQAPGMIWWEGYWPHYSLGYYMYLTTAKAAIALYEASQLGGLDSETKDLAGNLSIKAARYLTVNLDWLRSYNTFESAAVLEAINTLGLEIQFLQGTSGYITYTIYANNTNGQVLFNASIPVTTDYWSCYIPDLTHVTMDDVWCLDTSYINYMVEGNWLNITKTLYIVVRLSGNATANWFADTYYLYLPSPSSGAASAPRKEVYLATSKGPILVIKQSNDNKTYLSNLIDISKEVVTPVASPNGTITVKLTVKSKNGTLRYVIVSDPIPPGYELVPGSINITPAGAAAFDEKYYNDTNHTALGFAITTLDETGVVIEYKLRVPSSAALGSILTLDAANATLFYKPSNQELEPATSNKPTVSIGVPLSMSARSMYYASASITNGTVLRWGEVLNISFTTSLPGSMLSRLSAELLVLDENLSVVANYSLDLARGWTLIVTPTMASLSTMDKLVNKTVYFVILVKDDHGNTVARKALAITLSKPTLRDYIDMIKKLPMFWAYYSDQPWFNSVYIDLIKAITWTWALAE